MSRRVVVLAIALAAQFLGSDSSAAENLKRGKGGVKTPDVGFRPPNGLVPDSDTAIAIARIVAVRAFGERIRGQEPLVAREFPEYWEVEGSLHPEASGGVVMVRLSKSDGRILFVDYGK